MQGLRGKIRLFGPFLIAGIFILSFALLYKELRAYDYREIMRTLRDFPGTILLLAAGLTVANYTVLTLFDALAFRYVGEKLRYPKIALTSFVSYVFSYNIGLSVFGAGAVRLRFYSAWGLSPQQIFKIIGFCILTFWIGFFSLGGIVFVAEPPASGLARPVGVLFLALATLYGAASVVFRRPIRFRNFEATLPSFGLVVGQILISSLDWLSASAVLYVLLPRGSTPFLPFLSVFMFAQFIGLASHVPGGLGVLETVLLMTLGKTMPGHALFAALLAYRGIYYLFPLVVAAVVFFVREIARKKTFVNALAAGIGRFFPPVMPTILAFGIFISGAILLISGSVPSLAGRLEILEFVFPAGIMEASHFTASLTGLGLLVVSLAVARRIDAAFVFSVVLLLAGIVLSLLKGLDYEEALVLTFVLLLLLPARKFFYRRSRIFGDYFSPLWSAAVIAVLAGAGWIGFFAHKHVQYSSDLWWRFELSRSAPRFLRATLGVSVVSVLLGLKLLLGPVRNRAGKETLSVSSADVERIVGGSSSAASNLAYLGDKYFLFDDQRTAFIMYGISGTTWVAMGDPVGQADAFQDLIWKFYELAKKEGGAVVFYEIPSESLPLYIELGLSVLKIGEEASVPLSDFSLEGPKMKHLRATYNRFQREDLEFSVLPKTEVPKEIEGLENISNEWIRSKGAAEKGFSLGFFDRTYVERFPCAVLRREGKIVAFVNLWTTGDKSEISVDLMRHREGLPNGLMEYLFIRIMLWGRDEGFRSFNLGMAPFSGVQDRRDAPLWNKAVSLFFQVGEKMYNFQGVRRFKEKFFPRWSSKYFVGSRSFLLPIIGKDVAALISRGRKGALFSSEADKG